jgi:hypothetical protein
VPSNRATAYLILDDKGFSVGLGRARTKLTGWQRDMAVIGKRMQSVGKTMTKYVTLPIVGGFALATKAAMDDAKGMQVLHAVIQKTAHATAAQTAANDAYVNAMAVKTGIDRTSIRLMEQRLLPATKNVAKAQELATLAMDLGAGMGKDATTVATALTKAYLGVTSGLSRFGIKTNEMVPQQKKVTAAMALASKGMLKEGDVTTTLVKKTLPFSVILARLHKQFDGLAAKKASPLQKLAEQLKALEISFGNILLPVVTKLAGWLGKLATSFTNLSTATKTTITKWLAITAVAGPVIFLFSKLLTTVVMVGSAVRTLALTFGALRAAMVVGGFKAMVASFVAMTGPVGLAAAAIAALGVGAYLLTKHFDQVKAPAATFAQIVGGKLVVAGKALSASTMEDVKALAQIADRMNAAAGAAKTLAEDLGTRLLNALEQSKGKITASIRTLMGEIDVMQKFAAHPLDLPAPDTHLTAEQFYQYRVLIMKSLHVTGKEADYFLRSTYGKQYSLKKPNIDPAVRAVNAMAAAGKRTTAAMVIKIGQDLGIIPRNASKSCLTAAKKMVAALRDAPAEMKAVGYQYVTDLASGMAAADNGAARHAARIAEDISNGFKRGLKGSPQYMSYHYGQGYMDAFGQGVTDALPRVSGRVQAAAGSSPWAMPTPAYAGASSGGGSGGGGVHVHVHMPGGTTLIGTARQVGEAIAPHVAAAIDRANARTGRRR